MCLARIILYTLAAPLFAVWLMVLGVIFLIELFIEVYKQEVRRRGVDPS